MSAANIGGWSATQIGISPIMMEYGPEGLTQSEPLKALYQENKIIHQHLSEYFSKMRFHLLFIYVKAWAREPCNCC